MIKKSPMVLTELLIFHKERFKLKHIVFALSASILVVIAGVVHRILFRVFGFPFDQAIFFWGGFVVVYFILALLASLLFRSIGSNNRSSRYEA